MYVPDEAHDYQVLILIEVSLKDYFSPAFGGTKKLESTKTQ